MTKTEIIEGMLDLLNSPERWVKNFLSARGPGGKESYCLLGAMFQVATGKACWSTTYRREDVADAIRALGVLAHEKGYVSEYHYSDAAHSVAMFNNAVETEYEDIRLFLKEALVREAA